MCNIFLYVCLPHTTGEEVTCVMKEQHPNVEFDVEQEYELVWRSESQLNEKVIINTNEQVPHLFIYSFIYVIFVIVVIWWSTVCSVVIGN